MINKKKCNIKTSDICDFCKEETDSNFHMLIDCRIIKALWWEVSDYIIHLGETEYVLNDEKKS